MLDYSKKDSTFWSRLEVSMYPQLQQQFLTNGITMPPNLIVVGTMNTDESTQPISKKVLDRAMTFEMNDISMYVGLSHKSDDFQYPDKYLPADFLIGSMNDGYDVYQLSKENGDKIIKALENLDFILADTKFRFGYRVRNEILIYCYFNSLLNDKPGDWLNKCIDEMILVKILPKLNGDLSKNDILPNLLKCTGQFPSSHQKVLEIQSILTNQYGYSSFWKS